jgi:bla regulator protein BlaR1
MMPFTDPFLRALGWVLAHSLWQGALAALILFMVLPGIKSASNRFLAAYLSLSGIFLAAVGTFFWKYEPENPVSQFTSPGTNTFLTNILPGTGALETTPVEQLSQWIEANHFLIVALWIAGLVFFMFRLGSGLWGLHRLRTRGLQLPESLWTSKVQDLAGRMGIRRSVILLESALVRAPLTLGWLEPLILLPIGMVNRLSIAEVEAILAHELAHIARRDWFFHLLQAFVESLFYYHPAVWWISGIIHRERENACDDAALALTGNPVAFAKALVQVQELATPALSMALGGKQHSLLHRVRRILNQAPVKQKHQVMEKITASAILLFLLLLVGMRANNVPGIEKALAQMSNLSSSIFDSEAAQWPADSLPKPKTTRKITREDGDKRVEAEYQNGELSKLSIDGVEIPAAEFSHHEALLDELSREIPAPPAPPAPPGAPAFPGFHHFDHPEAPDAPIPSFPPFPPFPPMDGFEFRLFDDRTGFFHPFGETPEARAEFLEKFTRERNEEMEQAMKEAHEAMDLHLREYEREMKNSEKEREAYQKEWEKAQEQWEKARQEWQREQEAWQRNQEAYQHEMQAWQAKSLASQERLKATLLNDGLISDPNNFSFKLSAKELKINKKKQPEALRQKYQELLQSMDPKACQGDNWNYNMNFNAN